MKATPFRRSRSAIAAVELAAIVPFLFIVLVGIWEVGRLIQVQEILDNAAREGARLAAQGLIINKEGEPTQIHVNTGSPNVEASVRNYLREAGIKTDNLSVTFQFVTGDSSKTQPFEADKGQRYRIKISIPFENVRWTLLGLINKETLSAEVEWESLVDDPFTLNTLIPNW